jgi:hypothetical protein
MVPLTIPVVNLSMRIHPGPEIGLSMPPRPPCRIALGEAPFDCGPVSHDAGHHATDIAKKAPPAIDYGNLQAGSFATVKLRCGESPPRGMAGNVVMQFTDDSRSLVEHQRRHVGQLGEEEIVDRLIAAFDFGMLVQRSQMAPGSTFSAGPRPDHAPILPRKCVPKATMLSIQLRVSSELYSGLSAEGNPRCGKHTSEGWIDELCFVGLARQKRSHRGNGLISSHRITYDPSNARFLKSSNGISRLVSRVGRDLKKTGTRDRLADAGG